MNARAASTLSLLLLSVLMAAGQYSDLKARLEGAESSRVIAEVRASKVASDPGVDEVLSDPSLDIHQKAEGLKSILRVRSRLDEGEAAAPAPRSATSSARAIKASPLYRDPGVHESSNWLSRALARLRNIKFDPDPPKGSLPTFSLLGPWVTVAMWGIIAAAIGFLIYLAVRHIRWKQRLERKASALLDEGEPERTLDEWLAQADALEAEGRHREAVRALYLACLLRFDQALIARFDRSQTNWEHLARIESSPKKPAELDFRTPTGLFDRVWYGRIVQGAEDVAKFRRWYVELVDAVTRRAA